MNRHQTECKQIHSPTTLTDSQRDVFIRRLLEQVNRMSGKITEMQTEISYLKKKQKNQLATLLNNQSDFPTIHIFQWIKTLPVSQAHLELVFRKSLEDGIKQVFIDAHLSAKNVGSNIPLRAYSEKQKCIFIYLEKEKKETPKWVLCDNANFKKMCGQIASRFIELFVLWQTTQDFGCDDDGNESQKQISDSQEQNMHFMKKVMDNTYTQPAHLTKMIDDLNTIIRSDLNISEYT